MSFSARATTLRSSSALVVAVAFVAVAVYLSYRFAARLVTMFGDTGTVVFTRLSSFILLCVGVSIIWSGILGLIEPLLK